MIGMLTFDAFAFVQVTFLFSILIGLGAALLMDPPPEDEPIAAAESRAPQHVLATIRAVVP